MEKSNFAKKKRDFRPVILITGASSGIGLAVARILEQQDEYRVVITGRRTSLFKLRSEFEESSRLWVRPLDVTIEDQRQELIAEIDSKWGGVDILINNAGISYRAVMEHMTEADEVSQMTTNYLGPVALMRAVLPTMRLKGRGKIINISSLSGLIPMPTMSSYTASKYALEGASESLWYEARPLGIDVVLLEPGFIRSESFQRVHHSWQSHPNVSGEGPYCDYYRSMTPFIERLMNLSRVTPEKIAKLVLRVIRWQRPPLRIAATPDAILFVILRRLIPQRWLQPFLFNLLPGSGRWAEFYTQKRASILESYFKPRKSQKLRVDPKIKKTGTEG